MKRSVTVSPACDGVTPGLLNMSKEMTLSPTFMRVRMTDPRKWAETTLPVSAVSLLTLSESEPASGRSASEIVSPALWAATDCFSVMA
ncbi:hypothetical protein AMK06_CH03066 [Rhizobium sp. N541]|nr:hypothetical protein AMK05_CH03109 [Rhizobium sp. N324]ANM17946.1 hypothetical protein AMK06_CH03066 [Rhizobium sp. N541]ANM24332.1 hypothetical protein AMK07_CH03064 [Rhizobium sp. N941]OYD05078.1 hypothetical protein AMK08_CH103128 [Rhizobium sp. N4311]